MKIELASSEDVSRYLVRHPAEVERILREVMNSKNIVTAYADDSKDFMLTSIIGIDPDSQWIYLDYGADEEMNTRLLASREVTLSASHDQVRIQFTAAGLDKTLVGHEPALRAPIPHELLRLQRREYYRLVTSLVNPIKCIVHTEQGELETVVVDISIGGIGVLAYQQNLPLHVNRTYHGCRITLPGIGQFAASISVCSLFHVTLRNGRNSHRAGCQFIDLAPSLETEIQRYIIRVDRERRNRYE